MTLNFIIKHFNKYMHILKKKEVYSLAVSNCDQTKQYEVGTQNKSFKN